MTAPRRGKRPIGRANASEDWSGAQTLGLHRTSDVLAESPRGSTEVGATRGQDHPRGRSSRCAQSPDRSAMACLVGVQAVLPARSNSSPTRAACSKNAQGMSISIQRRKKERNIPCTEK